MKSFLDLFFPPRCMLCSCLLEDKPYLCGKCRETAPWYGNRKRKLHFLDSVTAVWYYKENVRSSLLRFKFHNQSQLASGYGKLLGTLVRNLHGEDIDLLTYVPCAAGRRLHRGYDQAELLCRAVGKELGLKPRRLLKKIRSNPAQSGITDPSRRRANVLGVYRLRGKEDLSGKRILLVDDILTTGATAGECARTLRTAGASQVHLAVVAVAERD